YLPSFLAPQAPWFSCVIGDAPRPADYSLRFATEADLVDFITAMYYSSLGFLHLDFELAELVIEEGLSVRAVEALVKNHLAQADKPVREEEEVSKEDAREYRAIEDDLKSFFSTKVKLKPLGKRNKGKIEIEYYSDEDLERLLALLKR
ncbi:MAG: hypothetical protein IKY38_03305, partial [Anaerotignum sp.]|nr:hypothetical protein [Anaerotignum sp.]